jgi:serine/threonine protein kinase
MIGIASRLPRERQSAEPPEMIPMAPPGLLTLVAGTLAYMAPEQTGRMNRSIDYRSDLYSLGVSFYQMLTGMSIGVDWPVERSGRSVRTRFRKFGIPYGYSLVSILSITH